MTIYRGEGGGGDATVDTELNQFITIKQETLTAASNADASAVAAAASEASAASLYDSFDDRYLGSKASAPSVDNDGNALLEGALYWNSTDNLMFVYNGLAWVNIALDVAETLVVNNLQLGDSLTATNNFVLKTNADGTAKLSRGNVGATTQDILTVDADGRVDMKLKQVVSVKDFGAVGDGSDETAKVQAAVTHCYSTGDHLYWPDGTYLTTASISNLHAVRHLGPGAVQRGSDIYRVQPGDTNTNILYVAPAGTSGNDGLSASQPTTIGQAFNIFKAFGSETLNGVWRIQMAAGTYTDTGVTLAELPFFKNKLEIFGAAVDETLSTVPTTIWDGAVSGSSYAIRLDSASYPSASANMFIKNIKLQNWTAGGLVVWSDGNVVIHNVHIDACPIGMWFRHGYFKVWYGVVNNCSTWGVGIQYNATGNVGSATAGTGVLFTNCSDGVQVGRYTVCYVQRCTFTNCDRSIEGEWLARVRPVYNTFNTPNSATITLRGNSLLTTGSGENTLPTLSESLPYHRSESGSVNPDISRYGQRCLHNYAGSTLEQGLTPVTLFSVTTTSQILLSDGAYGGSDFVPFRLPAYALYSPTFELEVEIGIALNANAGGTLALHGQGSSLASKLCEITIPTAATYRRGNLRIKVKNTPNSTLARYEIHFPVTGLYAEGVTGSLDSVLIRDSSDSQLLFRLYWTSATVDQVQLFNMRTYVTE